MIKIEPFSVVVCPTCGEDMFIDDKPTTTASHFCSNNPTLRRYSEVTVEVKRKPSFKTNPFFDKFRGKKK